MSSQRTSTNVSNPLQRSESSGSSTKKRPRSSSEDDDKNQDQDSSTPNPTEQRLKKMSIDNNDKNRGVPSFQNSRIRKLRLEAMFHPKFDNEIGQTNVRLEMMKRVSNRSGYLEVTLKHSGSLVLWSGGQRYYSKNSTDNSFTSCAEILLRQHFERAWRTEPSPTTTSTTKTTTCHKYYDDCSRYLQDHRLTLALEVVTAVLGDHGDVPHRDFCIVTAVADRAQERFYSTPEVLELTQGFRLPHNDAWMCSSRDSCDALFALYDHKSRETGLARDTVEALTQAAEVHVPSLYPHVLVQGDLLEGYVIRYISYHDNHDPNETSADQVQSLLQDLSRSAKEILTKVPPERPASFQVEANQENPVLGANLRSIYQKVVHGDYRAEGPNNVPDTDRFAKALRDVLANTGPRRSIQRVLQLGAAAKQQQRIDLPSLTKELLVRCPDKETQRIAELLQTVGNLGKPVTYTMVQEDTPLHDEEQQQQGACGSSCIRRRTLCVIHVLHDATFQRFHKEQKPGSMDLFRGFCIELQIEDEDGALPTTTMNGTSSMSVDGDDAPATTSTTNDSLMLKMKCLPYMVRTFLCRNQLPILQQEGPEAFLRAAKKLLDRWEISHKGKQRWIPFLEHWAVYAKACLDNPPSTSTTDTDTDTDFGTDTQHQLPPLTTFAYLAHINHFIKLYENGETTKPSTPAFRGLVCVVAPRNSTDSENVAKRLAEALGGANVLDIAHAANNSALQGSVCYAHVAEHSKIVKSFLKEAREYSAIVLYGCSKEEINIEFREFPLKELKKCVGMSMSWKKQACGVLIHLPRLSNLEDDNNSTIVPSSAKLDKAIEQIQKATEAAPRNDADGKETRAGLLAFFPGIPGCGKSSILASMKHELQTKLSQRSNGKEKSDETERQVYVGTGDELGKLFWPTVKATLLKDRSCLFIGDKNAPPASWNTIGGMCCHTRDVPLPVLPDSSALKTTFVKGARKPDDTFSADISHCYPFSLTYLAVCMARVLDRKPSSHPGKLDSGAPTTCMVVIKFFSLYRYLSADEIEERLKLRLEKKGALNSAPPIRLPFLADSDGTLPSEVEETLIEALQLQFGYDVSKTKVKPRDARALDMESRLRQCIGTYRDVLLSKAVDISESRRAFVQQVIDRVSALDDEDVGKEKDPRDRKIKLVSIDVEKTHIHQIFKQNIGGSATGLLNIALRGQPWEDCFQDGCYVGENFVSNTHVTMAFCDRTTQAAIKQNYGAVQGCQVEVRVKGILWSKKVAALAVDVAEISSDGKMVAKCENDFSHITIWFAEDAKSYMSNHLPEQVESGKAKRIDFPNPVPLRGTISFWDFENKPLPIQS